MKKIIVVGASSAIAEHCMRLWVASEPVELILAGRDEERLNRVVADLKIRQPLIQVQIHVFDFNDLVAIEAFVKTAFASGPVTCALIAQGYLGEQAVCQQNLAACRHVLEVNGLIPVLFAETIANAMEIIGFGQLAVIGSVAGDRGRKSNYIYGAAKGLVERYIEGMQHRFAKSNVKIILIKPGPTATPMTANLQVKGSLAAVDEVARQVVQAIDQGKGVVYAPRKWAVIMGIVKRLPRFVFERLDI
jgi:decaprenylphospho-beta-D-erythro-pentofuranosid-2-ulose 2-reductase